MSNEILKAVAPFLISQCYNIYAIDVLHEEAVAPFLISQCYNLVLLYEHLQLAVAPFLISQCYNKQEIFLVAV